MGKIFFSTTSMSNRFNFSVLKKTTGMEMFFMRSSTWEHVEHKYSMEISFSLIRPLFFIRLFNVIGDA